MEGAVPYVLQVMLTVLPGPIDYYYAYIMPCWVPISMEFIGNNVYEKTDNPSFVLKMDGVAASDWHVRSPVS
ncbi:hypothetical protein IEQ34_000747 [Dendrobium chrysotoxum]|uniref:Uncharacterized protein n=1 Tax=Dendrobium chrysotoxum TaxID=161865 RepID=A0AAV7HS23_DENCH|nr:hypothetical protein IEQ34_000229 [Dendrobium chrysotoxum]KAH0471024.1 hypothetical protein IEQ34_000747 [Dendrobium chrysotoxum]